MRRQRTSIVTGQVGDPAEDLSLDEQDNADGEDHNLSWNCGSEGPTEDVPFRLPSQRRGESWERILDTSEPFTLRRNFRSGTRYLLEGRSVAVLRRTRRLERRVGLSHSSRRLP